MAAYDRRAFSGGSQPATLTALAGAADTVISVSSTVGWPNLTTGKFYIVVDPGNPSEETMLVSAYTSSTVTVARGVDGTTGTSHQSGATVYPCTTSVDMDEANQLVHALLTGGTTGQVVTVDTGLTPPIKLAAPAAASGTAGGDLTGSYPNPTLAAAGPGAAGPIGDATHAAAVTIDAKGRVTALSSVAITHPTKTFRQSYTYAFSGAVGNVTLPLFEVGLASGESKALVKVITKLSAGTITAQVTRNGSNLGSAISVTSSKLSTALSQALSDGDDLAVVLSAGSSPTDLTVTFMVDATA